MNGTVSLHSAISRSWRIWLMRAAWLAVAALVAVMFAASLPHAVGDIFYYEWQVLQIRPIVAVLFASYADFVDYLLALRLLAVAVFWAVALFIVWRKPADGMVLFTSATLLMMSYLFVFRTNADMWRFPQLLVATLPAVKWMAPGLFASCFVLLLYLFPDGHFSPAWLRWVPSLAITLIAAIYGAEWMGLVVPDPAGWYFFISIVFAAMALGLFGQISRFRRAAPAQQRQIKFITLALAAFTLTMMSSAFLPENGVEAAWIRLIHLHLLLFLTTLIPVAIGLSALRFRLWEMDAFLNRALVYGLLSLVLFIAYVLVIGGLALLFQARVNVLTAAIATGVAAVAAQPLRDRLQRLVNRLLYGAWDDPFAVINTLGRQLEQITLPDTGLTVLVTTVAETLRLPYVALRTETGDLAAAGHRLDVPLVSFPLTYRGLAIGDLVIAPRGLESTFTLDEARLLRNIARQAGSAVYAAQVTHQLQRSREQLVTTREEERRRLRRDLHDGLGPSLATMAIKAGAAENYLQSDPVRAGKIMGGIRTDAETMVTEIRRLVNDLRPAALDQLGLLAAARAYVEQQSEHGAPFVFVAPADLPPLPAAVEVAAYRILTEAVANVVRHAAATNGVVRLGLNGDLVLEIEDDGRGLPAAARPGVGLASMRERAEELGGHFDLRSNPGQGTHISVRLPLEPID